MIAATSLPVLQPIETGRAPMHRTGWLFAGLAALVLAGLLCGMQPAAALTSIRLDATQDVIDVTAQSEFLDSRGDSIRVETAPASDGMTGQMAVRASTPGLNPNWIVFALTNTTDRQIERWVTAQRYSLIGSGIVWPDLDARRLEAVTPSLGFLPDRVKSDSADIFRITLEPGQTVTYVAELASDRFARIYVWKPLEYELKARERQLYHGILLGITGVLGIFLTAVFAANHKPIFPSAALVTWCVLAYLCVDFGFWHKLFQLRPEDNAVYRAATEASMAASLLVFLHIFLRLTAAHGILRMLLAVWMIAQLALIAVAVIDARLAATFARASFALIGAVGMAAIGYLAVRGQDRALSMLPTWILFLVWIFAAAVTLTGRMSGDAVVSSLTGGLVLITVLIGFTVTQFAFRSLEPMFGNDPGEHQVRSMAIDRSGAAVWEWNARREEIKTGPLIEATLGLNPGELTTKVDTFCSHLHLADRERFRLLLWSVQERSGGEIRIEFRMLHSDNSYRWFDLEAASVPSTDRRVLRCVGLMREITDAKRAQERLLHDAVHCSLTGLPNRELFLDRLGVAVVRAKTEPMIAPTVILIDMDKFKSVNASFGLVVGDSLLLTLARRLQRHLAPQDTLSRLGGNQFAILMMQAHEPSELAQHAERIRRSLRSPIKLGGQDIVLTGALGIAIWDDQVGSAEELLKEAEVAMYRAKRGGADRVEIFSADMRGAADDRSVVEAELRQAIERQQLFVLYQPIISLGTEELAGYEALMRWQHPKLGLLNPADFVPATADSDLIVKLGSYVLGQAVADAAQWQKLLPRNDRPLFVSVNVSSRQLFRPDLIQEIRQIIGRVLVPPGCLRLEITESLVMENPEQAVEVLEWLRAAGAGLSLDDFGTGYSSLSYLQRFPFDTIKIDRDLVQASNAEGTGSTIVRSIVALAHELGKKVVAEGVEMQADVGFLRSIGCEYAQGVYYGGPIPQREVEKMLRLVRKTETRMQKSGLFRTKSKRKAEKGEQRRAPAEQMTAAATAATADGQSAPPQQPSKTPDRAGSTLRKRTRGPVQGARVRASGQNGAGSGQQAQMPPQGPAQAPPQAAPQPPFAAATGQPPMPPMPNGDFLRPSVGIPIGAAPGSLPGPMPPPPMPPMPTAPAYVPPPYVNGANGHGVYAEASMFAPMADAPPLDPRALDPRPLQPQAFEPQTFEAQTVQSRQFEPGTGNTIDPAASDSAGLFAPTMPPSGASPPVNGVAPLQGLAELLAASGSALNDQAPPVNAELNGHAAGAPPGPPPGLEPSIAPAALPPLMPAYGEPQSQPIARTFAGARDGWAQSEQPFAGSTAPGDPPPPGAGAGPDLSTLPPAIAASLAKLAKPQRPLGSPQPQPVGPGDDPRRGR